MSGRIKAITTVILTGLVLPIASKILERLADRAGFLDNPSTGVRWLLSTVSSITEAPLFYPTVCGVIGFALGLWVDDVGRKFANRRSQEHASLGSEMQYLEGEMRRAINRSLEPWPTSAASYGPSLQSLFIKVRKANIWAPGSEIMTLNDGGKTLFSYLSFVGKLLADGHQAEAQMCALQCQRDLIRLSLHSVK
jgi:hypothetical protein